MSSPTDPAGLSAEQILELATVLLAKRDELLRRARSPLADAGAGDEVRDAGDAASAEDRMRVHTCTSEHHWSLLREIEHALGKIRDGTYGVCEETDEPIGYERLAACPWSICSIAGQEARECPPRRRGTRQRRTSSPDVRHGNRDAQADSASEACPDRRRPHDARPS